jgi:hypothetical protein
MTTDAVQEPAQEPVQEPAHEPPSTPDGNLPSGWSAGIIGASANSGSVTYEANAGTFVVGGAGADIWGRLDGFCFVYRTMNGDGQIVARVANLPRADLAAKAGIMIRQSLDPDSKHVALLLTPTAGVRFVRRPENGGATTNTSKTDNRGVSPPCWLKLERRGVTLTAYRSTDGNRWQFVGTEFVGMSPPVFVGLAVTSHTQPGAASHASTFDHVGMVE